MAEPVDFWSEMIRQDLVACKGALVFVEFRSICPDGRIAGASQNISEE